MFYPIISSVIQNQARPLFLPVFSISIFIKKMFPFLILGLFGNLNFWPSFELILRSEIKPILSTLMQKSFQTIGIQIGDCTQVMLKIVIIITYQGAGSTLVSVHPKTGKIGDEFLLGPVIPVVPHSWYKAVNEILRYLKTIS